MAKSVYYYNLNLRDSTSLDDELISHIKSIYYEHKGRYGYRRVHLELLSKGIKVNHKKVSRIMRELGLKGLQPKRKKYNSYNQDISFTSSNTLQQNFKSAEPLKKLVTDITQLYSRVDNKWLYLSSLMDLYNGEIINYKLSTSPTVKLAESTLDTPLLASLPKGSICHSDQGFQYKNFLYRNKLSELGLEQSMSRKGNCYDNASMESFFGTLKLELDEKRLEHLSIKDIKKEISNYISYYNNQRIRLDLKMSPTQYRLLHQAA